MQEDAIGFFKAPSHYASEEGGLETLDKIRIAFRVQYGKEEGDLRFLGALEFNFLKYVDRAPKKGKEEEDLGKASFYRRMFEYLEMEPCADSSFDPRSGRKDWTPVRWEGPDANWEELAADPSVWQIG